MYEQPPNSPVQPTTYSDLITHPNTHKITDAQTSTEHLHLATLQKKIMIMLCLTALGLLGAVYISQYIPGL